LARNALGVKYVVAGLYPRSLQLERGLKPGDYIPACKSLASRRPSHNLQFKIAAFPASVRPTEAELQLRADRHGIFCNVAAMDVEACRRGLVFVLRCPVVGGPHNRGRSKQFDTQLVTDRYQRALVVESPESNAILGFSDQISLNRLRRQIEHPAITE